MGGERSALVPALSFAVLLAACSRPLERDGLSGAPVGGHFGVAGASNPGGPLPSGGAGGRGPEREDESRYLAPIATGKYLWTANPLSGRVALIDVTTLSVLLETAGNGPRQVVGLPEREGRFGALVLNELSDDATLFRVSEDGRPEKHPPLAVHVDANAWSLSPTGAFAIAWTDARRRESPDPLETFQDITILSLAPGAEASTPLSVGSRPTAFAFSADETFAYAVADEGISVISLVSPPQVTALIAASDELFEEPGRRDVSFAPDASYALVRVDGRSEIAIIALPGGERSVVPLDGVVTDVDLSSDGEYAYAVLGNSATVVKIPIAGASAGNDSDFETLALTGHAFGSIALNTDASAAVLYSTVAESNRVSLVDTARFADNGGLRRYDLIAPVTAVFPSPDARFAVTFQGPAAESRKAGAFSLLLLSAPRVPVIQATDAPPAQVAFAADGLSALVTVRGDASNSFGAYVVDLPKQRSDFVALASPPEAAGVVPAAERAYVAQSHPEGRITFISTVDGSVQTLTGFELAARIRDRSVP